MDTNKLYEWFQLDEQLRDLKTREIALRKEIFAELFPEPKEGTNKVAVPGNAQLVATFPYNYKVDADSVEAALKHVPKAKQDTLVKWKPELAISVYRALSKKAMTDFTAECLTITPGTPSLKIVPQADA